MQSSTVCYCMSVQPANALCFTVIAIKSFECRQIFFASTILHPTAKNKLRPAAEPNKNDKRERRKKVYRRRKKLGSKTDPSQ